MISNFIIPQSVDLSKRDIHGDIFWQCVCCGYSGYIIS